MQHTYFETHIPNFCLPGADATLDFWMDAFKISTQTTYFQEDTPNFCLPGADATLQILDFWMEAFKISMQPTSKHIPQIFICQVLTQPCNLGFLDGCFQNPYATYLLRSKYPIFLSAGC
jgi:hypothetical protein